MAPTAHERMGPVQPRVDETARIRRASASFAMELDGTGASWRRCSFAPCGVLRLLLFTLSDVQVRLEPATGPLLRQLLQAVLGAQPVAGGHAPPAPVGTELPRVRLIGEDQVQHLEQALLELGIVDRYDDLNPAVEVAPHEVGGADVELERQAGSGRRIGGGTTEAVD